MVVGTYTIFEASESATLDINGTERGWVEARRM